MASRAAAVIAADSCALMAKAVDCGVPPVSGRGARPYCRAVDPRTTRAAALVIGAGRIAIGATFLVAPRRIARAWAGIDGTRAPAAGMVAASVGIRDLVLGVGLVRALQRDEGVRPWLCYGAAADAVDAAGALRNLGSLPLTGRLSLPLALGAAAAGAVLAGSTK